MLKNAGAKILSPCISFFIIYIIVPLVGRSCPPRAHHHYNWHRKLLSHYDIGKET